jgi:hypothetical protein
MRLLFLSIFLIVNLLGAKKCSSQGVGTFIWTTGAPTTNPGVSGAKFAVDQNSYIWYEHISGTTWAKSGDRIQQITGCSAPNYTPAKHNSLIVINSCTPNPEIYAWNGVAWVKPKTEAYQTISYSAPTVTLSNGGGSFNIPQGTVTGTGTANYVTKFSGLSAIANSQIQDNGTSVGVGASPIASAKMYVNGQIVAGTGAATDGSVLLRANYDGNNAQNVITEFGSGGIGLGNYMYQDGGTLWRSGFNYGAIGKSAIIATATGFKVLTAPYESVAAGSVLPTQPIESFSVSSGIVTIPSSGSTAATITGRDASNRITDAAIGTGLSFAGGTLSAATKVWTTATRPTPASGEYPYGFNTDLGKLENYDGTSWHTIPAIIKASATLNFPSTGAHSGSDLTVTVTGAAVGDAVTVAPGVEAIVANSCYTAWVSAANTVTVRYNRYGSGGSSDPASAVFNIIVTKFY